MTKLIHVTIIIFIISLCSMQLFSQTRYFVDASASGDNDGSTWEHAFISLQSALDVAVSNDEIWVAKGTYKPSYDYGLGGGPRFYHFRMIDGVAIYGGFAGDEDPLSFNLADRDFDANETVLSGDIGTVDDNSDNCYHVFYHPSGLGLTNFAILDGFTVRDGNANYSSAPHNHGGAMFNDGANSPTIRNCYFLVNYAGDRGGAIYNSQSSPVFEDCIFESNISENYDAGAVFISGNLDVITFQRCTFNNNSGYYNGGAIYIIYPDESISFVDCTFDGNSAGYYGGAIYVYEGMIEMDNCSFNNNMAEYGGAIYIYYEVSLNITDSFFGTNYATLDGGAIHSYFNNGLVIENTVFEFNESDATGGAINSYHGGTLTIKQSEFTENNSESGGAIYSYYLVDVDISDSEFSKNTAEDGGAIYVDDIEIIINNSTFSENTAVGDGGALYINYETKAVIQESSFTENNAYNGGAIFGDDEVEIEIEDCEFAMNISTNDGGAIHIDESYLIVKNSSFSENSANYLGGAIYAYYDSNVEIEQSTFSDNSSEHGGAIYLDQMYEAKISYSTFNDNNSIYSGGAIVSYYTDIKTYSSYFISNSSEFAGAVSLESYAIAEFVNCLFHGNNADYGGAAYMMLYVLGDFYNCTFAKNIAAYEGGALYIDDESQASFYNSIIWGNEAGNNGNQFALEHSSELTLDHSLYPGGLNDIYDSDNTNSVNIIDTINDDPKFVNPAIGDYRIKGNSPAADAGVDSYNSEDFDIRGPGFPRKLNKNDYTQTGTIDMGAYEYNSNTDPAGNWIFVKHDATGNNDGSNWEHAFNTLQEALDIAESGDAIWVAAGTYHPTSDNGLGDGSEPRLFHFQMLTGVKIYGGFAGNEDPLSFNLADRDFVTNQTILSGDLDGNDDFDYLNGGYQGVSGNDNVYHVIFNPTGLGLTHTAVLDGFTIKGGNADGLDGLHDLGGGIYNYHNTPTFRNLILKENYADGGSAIYIYNCNPAITNVLIVNNISQFGAVWIREFAIPTITNATIAYNHSVYGGGIFVNGFSDPVLNNSIIWGNTSYDFGRQIFLGSLSTLACNYCNYSNNSEDIFVGSGATFTPSSSITDNPLFVNPAYGDFRLYSFSPSVDAGNNSYNSQPTDIRGQNRIQNTTIDMGAYEWTEGIDPECPNIVYISGLYDGDTPGWAVTHFENLGDALAIACSDATVNISNYSHTGNVDMTGYTFIIGDGDFVLNGNLTGGLIQTPSTGRLVLPAVQNVQSNYPMGNGSNNFTLKIIPGNEPDNPILVRLVEKSVPGAVKSPMPFWEIEGDENLNATIVFRIDKSAIAPKTLNTNSLLRYFDGDVYLPFTEEQVTINDNGLYYEIVIINVNKF